MNKTIKFYLALLALLFALIVYIEFSRERPINWSPTYNETHKIPFGTYVFYEELDDVFPNSDIKKITRTPYEYFDEYYNWEDTIYNTSGNFIHIGEYADLDAVSAQELLDFASYGNTIFVSTNYMPQKFKDELNFDIETNYNFKGKANFNLTNSGFKSDSITIEKGLNNVYFSSLSPDNTTILGHQNFDSIPYVNFIKLNHEKGTVLLHLQPVAFTNYTLLKADNKKYAEAILSYLPEDTIHYNSKNKVNSKLSRSKLRFILSQPALRYAWYLGLISLLLFLIFNAKRKQRIVKVIKPHENTTVAFTKTIGNLYYETKDHNNLIDKKITYFLEYIRRVYFIDTQLLDEKFVKTLAQKSGKDKELISKLVNHIVHLRARTECTESNLINLNKQIEDFYNA